MTIYLRKNKASIRFAYNAGMVQLVKTISGRKYNPKTKEWEIPLSNVKEAIDKIRKEWVYGIDISNEIQDIYIAQQKERDRSLAILRNNIPLDLDTKISTSKNELYKFQRQGVAFLDNIQSGLLGSEPGLGKTLQTLTLSQINNSKKVLIFCPASLKFSWKDEIEKWYPGETYTIIEGVKNKRLPLWQNDTRFYICNYELLLHDIHHMRQWQWDYILADEATRISNPKAKQSKLIKTIEAKNKIAMTGTPFNNSIQDIWNIMDFCKPGILGTYWEFVERYCLKGRFHEIVGYKNLDELRDLTKHFIIRHKKEDVLTELPPRTYEDISIEMSPIESKAYEIVKGKLRNQLTEKASEVLINGSFPNVLVKLTKLKEVTDSLELITTNRNDSTKLETTKELLKDILYGNKKAIIFTEFARMAKILERELKSYNPLILIGETKDKDREDRVHMFNQDDEHKVMIMTSAGAYGLNLQRSQYVIHFDLPWSIAKLEQREGRCHRAGQKYNVVVYKLMMKDTIDEYINKVLYRKAKMAAKALGEEETVKKVKISRRDIQKILL